MSSNSRAMGLVVCMAGVLGLAADSVQAQWHYYYFDEPRPLSLDLGRIAVFQPEAGAPGAVATVADSLSKHGIAPQKIRPSVIPRMSFAQAPAPSRNVVGVQALVKSIAEAQDVEFVSPVFRDGFGPWIVTRHLHVGFHEHVAAEQAEAILARMNAGTIVARDWSRMKGVYRILSGSRNGFEVLATANELAQHPDVKFAEPDMIMTGKTSDVFPNDPGFGLSWGLHNTGQSGGTPDMDMDAPEAWDFTQGDEAIIVVVMDTGVQQNHPDLNLITGMDFTGQGGTGGPINECDNHGTAVAGTISAVINNNLGTVGIAPQCKVASARFGISAVPCAGTFSAMSSWLINALDWAQQIGARVTNNSTSFGSSSAHSTKYEQTRDAGIVHFSSAGNDGSSTIGSPASFDAVNAVAALQRNGNLAGFSTHGPGLFISAPGQDIYTTDRTGTDGYSGGDNVTISGTSFSSPYTAGVAGLVLSLDASLSPAQVERVLMNTAMDRGAAGYDTTYGWGFVNAFGAVRELSRPLVPCDAQKVTASDPVPDHNFGRSVAISGDVAAVGADQDGDQGASAGAVYLFRRNGMTWNQEDKLLASDGLSEDKFGRSVAMDGDVIIVGAPGDDEGALSDAGSAYIFRWNGVSAFVEEQKLTASDGMDGDAFGSAVAIDGDVAVIAATRVDNGATDSGAVYVFRWNGSTWDQEQKLTAFDPFNFDNLGFSVSVSGDALVASAPNDDDDGSGSGSVYAYRWNGSSWFVTQKITASDAVAGDRFGRSVALEGDDLIIGAYRDDGRGADAGSAYWLTWTGTVWNERQEFFAANAMDGDRFGQSVAISGDRVIVGAYLDDDAAGNAGSAYVFRRGGGGWVQDAELAAADAAADDEYGFAVAVSEDFAIAGAHNDDHSAQVNAGSSYILAVAGDCNENLRVDTCDIFLDPGLDMNNDGVIDECACPLASSPEPERLALPPENPASSKNRFLSILAGDPGRNQAIRVKFVSLPGAWSAFNDTTLFVGQPRQICENSGQGPGITAPDDCAVAPGLTQNWFWAAALDCNPANAYFDDWTQYGVVHLYHEGFIPDGLYDVQVITEGCSLDDESHYSLPLVTAQARWGDILGDCTTDPCSPPQGITNIGDVTGVLGKFQNLPGAPIKARCDLVGLPGNEGELDHIVSIVDVTWDLDAFVGGSYAFPPTDPCP